MSVNGLWQVTGEYFEACSCDSVCPCPTSGLAARPTKGSCDAALVFHVQRGRYGSLGLDGLSFVVVLHTPGPMIQGNWTVGLIVDERASDAQRDAMVRIAGGQEGGPMAALAPLIGTFAGVQAGPITIERRAMRRSVSVPGVLDLAIEGIAGAFDEEPIYLENVAHPASSRLALAKASRSSLHAFGIDWNETSGRNNGHFAPFSWRS